MRGGNGFLLPQPQQQPPTLAVAQPLNDVQLVALVAAQLYAAARGVFDAAELVSKATEIVAEAAVQFPKLGETIKRRQEQE